MKILFSGSSSFTGFWFIQKLHEAGHEVVATYRSESYSGIRRKRVHLLENKVEQVFSCPFGSESFLSIAGREKWDLYCHHAAETENYRSPQFDFLQACQTNTYQIEQALQHFPEVILTGSYFETPPFSPYGLSKLLTKEIFSYFCLNLRHFTIPNPFGPYEDEKLTTSLVKKWMRGSTPSIRTPEYIRDHIHVERLAESYVNFCTSKLPSFSPSQYPESIRSFTLRFAKEMEKRLNIPCPIHFETQLDFSEPLKRMNSNPLSEDSIYWDNLAAYYLEEIRCLQSV